MDNDFISDYELYDNVFDFAFLNNFFSNETENNTTGNKIESDSLLASNASDSNTLDVLKHFDVNQHHNPKGEGARWVKRRRFKKGTEEYILWRREIKLKNRISARKSIEKKKVGARCNPLPQINKYINKNISHKIIILLLCCLKCIKRLIKLLKTN